MSEGSSKQLRSTKYAGKEVVLALAKATLKVKEAVEMTLEDRRLTVQGLDHQAVVEVGPAAVALHQVREVDSAPWIRGMRSQAARARNQNTILKMCLQTEVSPWAAIR